MSPDQIGTRPRHGGPDDEAALPKHVTMPLLSLIVEQSLDSAYGEAARRTASDSGAATDPKPGAGRLKAATVAVVLAFGVIVSVAAVQSEQNTAAQENSREWLIQQINLRNAGLSADQSRLTELRADNSELQTQLDQLDTDVTNETARSRRLGARTGFEPVRGPGLILTITDGPPSEDGETVVRDEDLAILVDGLWAAGAEAIAINGTRLSALSSIRSAGSAIHINQTVTGRASVPLNPPYVVTVIGDSSRLQADLANTTHGLLWLQFVQELGFGWEMRSVEDVRLPAVRSPLLRETELLTEDPAK